MLIRPLQSRANAISYGVVVLAFAIPFTFLRGLGVFWSVGAVVLWMLVAYAETLRNARFVEIDAAQNSIVVNGRTWINRERQKTYELGQFRFVISYISPGRNPENRVELLTHTAGEALCLVIFPVRASDKFSSRWTFKPHWHESPQATLVRERLATEFHLEDRGFSGSRWPGAQVRHNP